MVDPRAATGFAQSAAEYARGRPGYLAAAVDTVVEALALSGDSTVLDLAAGTGKLTRELAARVGTVLAVEPSRPMLAELRASVPAATALEGRAEDIPVADHAVQAVLVGQAFHWFEIESAVPEIARVLVADGGLGLMWNRERWDGKDHDWVESVEALVAPHREAGQGYPAEGNDWRSAFESTRLFEPLSSANFDFDHVVTPAEFLDLVASWSWIANLPRTQGLQLLERVNELIRDQPRVVLRYRTELYWSRLT